MAMAVRVWETDLMHSAYLNCTTRKKRTVVRRPFTIASLTTMVVTKGHGEEFAGYRYRPTDSANIPASASRRAFASSGVSALCDTRTR